VNVELAPTVPYASLGGVYSLTFTASPSCTLPDDAVTRTYTATIDQRGAPLAIVLSDARFLTSANQFFGHVLGNVVSFTLLTYYCPYYAGCVTEKLADNRYLSLGGTAQAIVTTPAEMTALFAGAVTVTSEVPGESYAPTKPIAACAAPDHRLVFTRTVGTSSTRSTVRSAIR
jgi:hypothetical protein